MKYTWNLDYKHFWLTLFDLKKKCFEDATFYLQITLCLAVLFKDDL